MREIGSFEAKADPKITMRHASFVPFAVIPKRWPQLMYQRCVWKLQRFSDKLALDIATCLALLNKTRNMNKSME